MSEQFPPNREESPEERFERISRMPGVRVYINPNPTPWVPPDDVRVNPGVTVRDILGYDDEDDPQS